MTFEWNLYLRNPALQREAEIDDYRRLELTQRWNDIGSWELALDRRAARAGDLTLPGWGIVVTRDGQTVLSGSAVTVKQSVSERDQTMTVSGVDDNVWLKRRQTSPSPAESNPPYTTAADDVRTGICSTVLRQYVNVNLGPGAISVRRKSGLVLGTDPLAGSTVTGRARWKVLLGLLQELATSGGGVGFRLIQVGTTLEFQTFMPADKTSTVKFSLELGNLASFDYAREAPAANYVYVGGGGEGTARTIYESGDAAAIATWGRIEGEFVDRRDTTATAELTQAATEALTKDQEKTSLSITPIDTAHMAYGVHYGLGDRVAVQVEGPGEGTIQDVVREVKITLTEDGPQKVTPTLGTPGRKDVVRLFQQFRAMSRRVENLERR